MKRQHVLVLLVVVAALAVAFFQMKSSPRTETASTTDDLPVATPQEEGVVMNETADQASAPDAAPAVEPAAKAADSDAEADQASEALKAEIKENLASARKVLQQKAAIEKAKPEEVHRMPKATLDAAKRLGEIAELEAQHPEQAESFKEFYLECARDENTITVTRAQCLHKYMKAAKLDAATQKAFLGDYPEEVVRLVEALQ